MKLINAGLGGLDYNGFLYNCTRNKACQRAFYVPIKQLTDLMFYADLPGKPDELGVSVSAIDACCLAEAPGEFDSGEFNEDFNIGGDVPCEYQAVFNNYVIAQKPNGSWYAVFGNPTITLPEGITLKCFFLKFTITVAASEYIYYTEEMCFEECLELTYLQGCYPNVLYGDAEDCNGVYYGFHQGPDSHLGTLNYRYFHWAYVRHGSVIDSKLSFNFTAFNSKKTYRSEVSKEKTLEFEIVPPFYKDTLVGIFSRGNIRINGVEHRLSDQQDFSVVDFDSKYWQLDVLLAEECKQTFGCGVSDCSLPVPGEEECDFPTDVNFEEEEEQTTASATLEHNGNPNLIPNSGNAVFSPNTLSFDDLPLAGAYIAGENINGVIFARVFQSGGTVPSLPHNPAASRIRYKDTGNITQLLAATLQLVAAAGPGNFDVKVVMGTNLPGDFEQFLDFSFTYQAGTVTGGTVYNFTFTGGVPLLTGQSIEWEVVDNTLAVVASGTITEEPLTFSIPKNGIDLDTDCYTVRWRKICSALVISEWQEKQVGNCP